MSGPEDFAPDEVIPYKTVDGVTLHLHRFNPAGSGTPTSIGGTYRFGVRLWGRFARASPTSQRRR